LALPAPKTSRAMNCTLLIHSRKLAVKGEQPPTQDELCKMLENKDDNIKIEGAKKSILMLLNGEKLPRLPMTVIRFCINTKDKMLKKLIMLYWEVVEKFDSEGKLKPEMILVW
jgi:coatomer subunit beta